MGKWNFRPHQNQHPSTDHKKLSQVTSTANLVHIHPSTGGFGAHGWNITKILFLFIPLFGVLFLGICSHALHLVGQKTHFGAWVGVFKPNSQNRKNVHIITNYCIDSNQILHMMQNNRRPGGLMLGFAKHPVVLRVLMSIYRIFFTSIFFT